MECFHLEVEASRALQVCDVERHKLANRSEVRIRL